MLRSWAAIASAQNPKTRTQNRSELIALFIIHRVQDAEVNAIVSPVDGQDQELQT